jgi:cobalt/nickel transport system permease protein
LNGLVGAVLGVAAFPAILIALLLQALLFQFGGLTTLGINTFNIALPALLAYFLCRRATESSGLVRNIFLFLTGFLPVALSSFFVAVVVALSGDQLMSAAKAIFATHLPLMVVEGIASVFILQFILKVYPSFLDK